MLEREYMEKEVKEEVKTEKKSKKGLLITLIVISSVLFVGLASFLVYLLINIHKPIDLLPAKKITITFNVDGGTEVKKMTFKKGTFVELPSSTKEGYEFKGWWIEKVNNNPKDHFDVGVALSDYWTRFLEDDITVKAKWEALGSDKKSMTLYFDAKGGIISGNNSNTSQSVVKCDDDDSYTVEGLPTVTKEGYSFVAWVDSHETPILTGAKLVCEDINLYANWTKEDEKWTCESGDGPDANHKCKLYMTPDKRCPSNTVEVKGSCIDKNVITAGNTNQDKIVRICGKSTVIMDSNGHTAEVQGTLTYVGDEGNPQYWYCAYGATDEGQYECTSHGHKWVSRLNKCYRSTGNPSANITYTCSQNDLIYLSTAEVNSLRQNANISGCFKTTARESYCSDSSYTLNGEYCIKYVDAKKSN